MVVQMIQKCDRSNKNNGRNRVTPTAYFMRLGLENYFLLPLNAKINDTATMKAKPEKINHADCQSPSR